MTHKSPFAGSLEEIDGMKKWASTFAGVSKSRIRGVRFPFRNYNAKAIGMIKKLGFEYDSSMSANSADAIWPYTLDNGSVNECMGSVTVCGQMLNASGLWEIPLYGTFRDSTMTHLMDPYNDPSLDNPIPPETLVSNYINHFNANYNGNRVPTGVYMHPIWLGSGNPPTIPDGRKKLKAITDFLDMAMANKDVWMVTHSQLLDYMKNPVPADQLSTQTYMKCPEVPKGICNGADPSLFQNCRLGGTQFSTCYNCPVDYPSLKIPIPKLQSNTRCMPPTDCDALFWDPVGCKCLCNNADCKSLDPPPVEDIDEQDINLQKSSDASTHDNESVKNSGENLSMELLTIASYLFITLYFQ
ncbi:hypothetical protein HDV02_006773 [Globomyces sp. JEL0801]|nr:hypothetical protein HDV02_006773 [Globomyces sp. JEL0801]